MFCITKLTLTITTGVALPATFFVDEGTFAAFGAEVADLHHRLLGGDFDGGGFVAVPVPVLM